MLIERDCANFGNLMFLDKYLEHHRGFVAGGCFKNIFNREPIKDVDVFFRSIEDFFAAKRHFEKNDDQYYPYYENDKVIAFKSRGAYANKSITIELIRTVFGEPADILNGFDFTITKFAYFKEKTEEGTETKVLHHDKYFEHLHAKRLVVDGKLPFPVSSFERMIRYIKYGYTPCRETKVRMIQEIQATVGTDGISASLYNGLD